MQENKLHLECISTEWRKKMYLRTKLQARAHDNLIRRSEQKYPGMRVTKGYVASELLLNYHSYIGDADRVRKAIAESDIKGEGGGIATNLNITNEANEKLAELKDILDRETGRSLFPAQVLDILLICALDTDDSTEQTREIPDKDLAKVLMDLAYKILIDEPSIDIINAKGGLINVLVENHLL